MSVNRFALLSAARSGTSLVMRTLEVHPDIWVAGEIFHPALEWHLPRELCDPDHLRMRENDPIGFVEQVFRFGAPKAAVGFKMWYDQNPAASEYVMKRKDIKKIILNRTNKLATYSSNIAADRTGIWNVHINDVNRYVPPPLFFSEETFDRHIRHHEWLFQLYRRGSLGEVLEITYSDVKKSGCVAILTFLGLTEIEIEPQTHRLLPEGMLDRFHPNARDRVIRYLSRIGKLEWLGVE